MSKKKMLHVIFFFVLSVSTATTEKKIPKMQAPAPPRITLHLSGHRQSLQGSAGAQRGATTTAGEGSAAANKTLPQQHQQQHQQQQHQSTKKSTTTTKTPSSSSLRIATAVAADLAALSNPDVDTAFRDADDAVDRLLPYHVRLFFCFLFFIFFLC